MAQPEMNQYPAADAGPGSNRPEWSLLSSALLDRDLVAQALRSAALGAARPSSPLAARRAATSDRISAVIESWRATIRELSELPPSSPDRPRLRALVEGLRDTHHRLFAERNDDSAGL